MAEYAGFDTSLLRRIRASRISNVLQNNVTANINTNRQVEEIDKHLEKKWQKGKETNANINILAQNGEVKILSSDLLKCLEANYNYAELL